MSTPTLMQETKMGREIKLEQTVPAKAEDVFYAVSTAQGWRDWLTDAAYFRPQPGGSFHLAWDTGWYAAGSVEALEKPSTVSLRWTGKDAPAATQVTFSLEPNGENTLVKLAHTGFEEGEDWEASYDLALSGWETGLENLKSIFDSGADLRIVRRPMLGIFGNDFSEEIATEIGVPVTEGTRLADAVPGMGAEKAGLQGDDVIVEMDGTPVRAWEDLGPVLQRRQAGDMVSVVYYRGPDKHQVDMELSGRPVPELDLDPAAFADVYRKTCAETLQELKAALKGSTESEAEFIEGDGWSVKENLAHLVVGEEWNSLTVAQFLDDNEPQYAGGGTNRSEWHRAVVAITPTVDGLVERLEQAQAETCRVLEESREVLKARKGVMWRLGVWWLQFPGGHEREHIEQIKQTLEKARAAQPESVSA